MGGNNKEALQRENTIRFIEAAEELIDEHGIDNVSVRKIAHRYEVCLRSDGSALHG